MEFKLEKSQAKWIGSPRRTKNTDGVSTYGFETKGRVTKGNCAGFIIGARNRDNYVLITLDYEKKKVICEELWDHAWDGSYAEGVRPTREAFFSSSWNENTNPAEQNHHVVIEVDGRVLTIFVDEVMIVNHEQVLPMNPPWQPRKEFMMLLGLSQEQGEAEYTYLKVWNTTDGDIYQEVDFTDANETLLINEPCFLFNPVGPVYVRKTFSVEKKKLSSAILYSTARGFYEAYLNGMKAGPDYYAPGFTDYRKRIYYQNYDVTEEVKDGENVLGAMVTKGYYSGYVGYTTFPMVYGTQNSFLGALVLSFTDGTTQVICTDETWEYRDNGPVIDADYQQGEQYDARMEFDWSTDHGFVPCGILEAPGNVLPTNGVLEGEPFVLEPQQGPSAVEDWAFHVIGDVVENPQGHFVYDFGQNMVGTLYLFGSAPRGTSLKFRYGETAYKNGEIYIKNVRTAANTDTYTFSGKGVETHTFSSTQHGFRFVEVTGNGYSLTREDLEKMNLTLEGIVLCNTTEDTGIFSCSDPLINKLQRNIVWGQRGNSLLVYTDCPQRNERMGWTGDAQVFVKTAAFNMNVLPFMRKWLQDLRDAQLLYNRDGAVPDTAPLGGDNRKMGGCAGWGDAAVIVPWELYVAYGDSTVLEENYEMMAAWIRYQDLEERRNFGVRLIDGVEVPEQSDLAKIPYIQVQQSRGDHLTFDESTPFILSATAYAAHVAHLMSKAASVLGKTEDSAFYEKRFETIRDAFCQAWVEDDGSISYWGEMSKKNTDREGHVICETRYSDLPGSSSHPSQTAYALAIDFGLIPEKLLSRTGKCFAEAIERFDGKLSTGFLGIAHLAPALTKVGRDDLAFSLLQQTGNPGWLYSVLNGATTIWERWNSYIAETDTFGDISMNSFNHYSYGAIGEWMYEHILGIRSGETPEEAGYQKIYLEPHFGGTITSASGSYETKFGWINVVWRLEEQNFIYECRVPEGTQAVLTLPDGSVKELKPGDYNYSCVV